MSHQLPSIDASIDVQAPTACAPVALGDATTVLPGYLPVPGMGVLPAHAFLVDGPEPMLVDAGPGGAQGGFQEALRSVIDPTELRWLWLTHTDPDHVGSLRWLLDAAPRLEVVTTFLAVGKLGMQMEVPMDRLLWVNPGTTVELNGRHLTALRPPSFDAPETTAFFDQESRTLFSADSFGALLARPTAAAGDVPRGELADGMALWTTIDSPWVARADHRAFHRSLGEIRSLGARRVLSSHLPPAVGITEALVEHLGRVPGLDPWVGPDQHALEQLLASVSS